MYWSKFNPFYFGTSFLPVYPPVCSCAPKSTVHIKIKIESVILSWKEAFVGTRKRQILVKFWLKDYFLNKHPDSSPSFLLYFYNWNQFLRKGNSYNHNTWKRAVFSIAVYRINFKAFFSFLFLICTNHYVEEAKGCWLWWVWSEYFRVLLLDPPLFPVAYKVGVNISNSAFPCNHLEFSFN